MSPYFPLPGPLEAMDADQIREAWLLVAEARTNTPPGSPEYDALTWRLWNIEWYQDQLE